MAAAATTGQVRRRLAPDRRGQRQQHAGNRDSRSLLGDEHKPRAGARRDCPGGLACACVSVPADDHAARERGQKKSSS